MQSRRNLLGERDDRNYEIIFFTYKWDSNKLLKDSLLQSHLQNLPCLDSQ